MSKNFYVTTAIEYVNGTPHVGHAYEKIGADIIARAMRMRGFDVTFQMGLDEHSTNVARQAASEGIDPLKFCDNMAEKFLTVWNKLNLSFDVFIRTTSQRHVESVQKLLQIIYDRGDIYLGKYEGYYCESCERFYQEKDLTLKDDGYFCPTHDIACKWLEEENYFFKLSKYQDALLKHIEDNPEFIQPKVRTNEIVNVLKEGLEDISISRSGVDWGVPLPWDKESVTYVWFDALINYLSAIGYGEDSEECRKFWPAQLQIIGKDITRFHCIYWPAMLMSAELELPKTIFGHGFVHFGGEKMSKTKGTVVDPLGIADQYGADALRYYLAAEIQWGHDGDFTQERFIERFNADLANNLGNMINRSLTMIKRYSEAELLVPENPSAEAGKVFDTALLEKYLECVDKSALQDLCRTVISMVDGVNLYIDQTQPWVLAKDENKKDELNRVLYNLAEAVRWIAICIFPVIPEAAAKIWDQAQLPGKIEDQRIDQLKWGQFPAGITVNKPDPIFPRIEVEKKD